MRSTLQTFCIALACLSLAPAVHAQLGIAGVGVTDADQDSMSHLEGIIGRPIDRHQAASTRPADVVRESVSWPDEWVVLIDGAGGMVWVIRPGDGVVVSRVLDSQGATPYAAAVVAAELLRIAQETPTAQVEPEAPHAVLERQASIQADGLAVELSAGGEASGDPGVGILLVRPSVAIGLAWAPDFGPLRVFAEAAGSLFGSLRQALPGDETSWVDYQRHDLALRLGLGWRQGLAELTALVMGGIALVSAEAGEATDNVLGVADRVSGWLGLGLRARVHFDPGFFVGLDAKAAWLLEPREFLHRDRLAIAEGSLRIGVGAHFGWRLLL